MAKRRKSARRVTTLAVGEENPPKTTQIAGEAKPPRGQQQTMTTLIAGEEHTTLAIGEEHLTPWAPPWAEHHTTPLLGEEVKTPVYGEEHPPTTLMWPGEEGPVHTGLPGEHWPPPTYIQEHWPTDLLEHGPPTLTVGELPPQTGPAGPGPIEATRRRGAARKKRK